MLREKVVPVVETCYALGEDLIAAADCMQRAFKAQRDLLVLATKHAQPEPDVFESLPCVSETRCSLPPARTRSPARQWRR